MRKCLLLTYLSGDLFLYFRWTRGCCRCCRKPLAIRSRLCSYSLTRQRACPFFWLLLLVFVVWIFCHLYSLITTRSRLIFSDAAKGVCWLLLLNKPPLKRRSLSHKIEPKRGLVAVYWVMVYCTQIIMRSKQKICLLILSPIQRTERRWASSLSACASSRPTSWTCCSWWSSPACSRPMANASPRAHSTWLVCAHVRMIASVYECILCVLRERVWRICACKKLTCVLLQACLRPSKIWSMAAAFCRRFCRYLCIHTRTHMKRGQCLNRCDDMIIILTYTRTRTHARMDAQPRTRTHKRPHTRAP